MTDEIGTAMGAYTASKTEITQSYVTVAGGAHRCVWQIHGPKPHYVVTSEATVLGTPETYVFACDETGTITNWLETHGSFKGALDHEQAIDGYIAALNDGAAPAAADSGAWGE